MPDEPETRSFKRKDFEECFLSVGMVAMNWSLFESSIDNKSFMLAKAQDEILACFAANIIGWHNKMNTYIALAKFRGVIKSIDGINKIATRAMGLAEQRNRIVHDPWILEEDIIGRAEMTAKRKLRYDLIEVDIQEIQKCAQQIAQLNADFSFAHWGVLREITGSGES